MQADLSLKFYGRLFFIKMNCEKFRQQLNMIFFRESEANEQKNVLHEKLASHCLMERGWKWGESNSCRLIHQPAFSMTLTTGKHRIQHVRAVSTHLQVPLRDVVRSSELFNQQLEAVSESGQGDARSRHGGALRHQQVLAAALQRVVLRLHAQILLPADVEKWIRLHCHSISPFLTFAARKSGPALGTLLVVAPNQIPFGRVSLSADDFHARLPSTLP